eukprot:SAG31_NODE_14_length_37953_cov_109.719660_4_plen_280_part_00
MVGQELASSSVQSPQSVVAKFALSNSDSRTVKRTRPWLLTAILDHVGLACLSHQVSVLGHVAHAAAAIELHSVPSHLVQPPDVTHVVGCPPPFWFDVLDATTAIEIPTHLQALAVAVVDQALEGGKLHGVDCRRPIEEMERPSRPSISTRARLPPLHQRSVTNQSAHSTWTTAHGRAAICHVLRAGHGSSVWPGVYAKTNLVDPRAGIAQVCQGDLPFPALDGAVPRGERVDGVFDHRLVHIGVEGVPSATGASAAFESESRVAKHLVRATFRHFVRAQ